MEQGKQSSLVVLCAAAVGWALAQVSAGAWCIKCMIMVAMLSC